MIQNFKNFFKENEADIILIIGVILISLISFGGGWLMGINSISPQSAAKENIKIEDPSLDVDKLESSASNSISSEENSSKPENNQTVETTPQEPSTEKQIVASKNGTVYHYVWCPGAKQIKEENKIYFYSPQEAEKAGYRPAKNCPGLGE